MTRVWKSNNPVIFKFHLFSICCISTSLVSKCSELQNYGAFYAHFTNQLEFRKKLNCFKLIDVKELRLK